MHRIGRDKLLLDQMNRDDSAARRQTVRGISLSVSIIRTSTRRPKFARICVRQDAWRNATERGTLCPSTINGGFRP